MDREQLHLTLMELWRELFHHELLPSRGFGTILQAESLISGDYLKNAGSYIIVSSNASPDLFNCDCIDIAPGYYACMYKYGMPYEMKYIKQLLLPPNPRPHRKPHRQRTYPLSAAGKTDEGTIFLNGLRGANVSYEAYGLEYVDVTD